MPERYKFVLKPKWIVSHLVVIAIAVLFISLGFWQLRRLDAKKAHNRVVKERTATSPAPIGHMLTAADGFGSAGLAKASSLEFRQVTATGSYQADQEVLVRGRSLGGAPGSWVLTPLKLSDGTALVINRGWISNDGRLTALPPKYRAPAGEVSITGLLQATQTRGSFGSTDPVTGTLPNLARADVRRLQAQVPERLVPAYAQLESQRPAPESGSSPTLLDPPVLDEGPHLSYAIQWFTFTFIGLAGYPIILRRAAREKERKAEEDAAEVEDAEEPDKVPV